MIFASPFLESSITIDNLSFLIDGGLFKEMSFQPDRGITMVKEKPISTASRVQRSGRVGRTCPGIVVQLLYTTSESFQPTPAILLLDLGQKVLEMRKIGVFLEQLVHWPSKPPNLSSIVTTLEGLGLLDYAQPTNHPTKGHCSNNESNRYRWKLTPLGVKVTFFPQFQPLYAVLLIKAFEMSFSIGVSVLYILLTMTLTSQRLTNHSGLFKTLCGTCGLCTTKTKTVKTTEHLCSARPFPIFQTPNSDLASLANAMIHFMFRSKSSTSWLPPFLGLEIGPIEEIRSLFWQVLLTLRKNLLHPSEIAIAKSSDEPFYKNLRGSGSVLFQLENEDTNNFGQESAMRFIVSQIITFIGPHEDFSTDLFDRNAIFRFVSGVLFSLCALNTDWQANMMFRQVQVERASEATNDHYQFIRSFSKDLTPVHVYPQRSAFFSKQQHHEVMFDKAFILSISTRSSTKFTGSMLHAIDPVLLDILDGYYQNKLFLQSHQSSQYFPPHVITNYLHHLETNVLRVFLSTQTAFHQDTISRIEKWWTFDESEVAQWIARRETNACETGLTDRNNHTPLIDSLRAKNLSSCLGVYLARNNFLSMEQSIPRSSNPLVDTMIQLLVKLNLHDLSFHRPIPLRRFIWAPLDLGLGYSVNLSIEMIKQFAHDFFASYVSSNDILSGFHFVSSSDFKKFKLQRRIANVEVSIGQETGLLLDRPAYVATNNSDVPKSLDRKLSYVVFHCTSYSVQSILTTIAKIAERVVVFLHHYCSFGKEMAFDYGSKILHYVTQYDMNGPPVVIDKAGEMITISTSSSPSSSNHVALTNYRLVTMAELELFSFEEQLLASPVLFYMMELLLSSPTVSFSIPSSSSAEFFDSLESNTRLLFLLPAHIRPSLTKFLFSELVFQTMNQVALERPNSRDERSDDLGEISSLTTWLLYHAPALSIPISFSNSNSISGSNSPSSSTLMTYVAKKFSDDDGIGSLYDFQQFPLTEDRFFRWTGKTRQFRSSPSPFSRHPQSQVQVQARLSDEGDVYILTNPTSQYDKFMEMLRMELPNFVIEPVSRLITIQCPIECDIECDILISNLEKSEYFTSGLITGCVISSFEFESTSTSMSTLNCLDISFLSSFVALSLLPRIIEDFPVFIVQHPTSNRNIPHYKNKNKHKHQHHQHAQSSELDESGTLCLSWYPELTQYLQQSRDFRANLNNPSFKTQALINQFSSLSKFYTEVVARRTHPSYGVGLETILQQTYSNRLNGLSAHSSPSFCNFSSRALCITYIPVGCVPIICLHQKDQHSHSKLMETFLRNFVRYCDAQDQSQGTSSQRTSSQVFGSLLYQIQESIATYQKESTISDPSTPTFGLSVFSPICSRTGISCSPDFTSSTSSTSNTISRERQHLVSMILSVYLSYFGIQALGYVRSTSTIPIYRQLEILLSHLQLVSSNQHHHHHPVDMSSYRIDFMPKRTIDQISRGIRDIWTKVALKTPSSKFFRNEVLKNVDWWEGIVADICKPVKYTHKTYLQYQGLQKSYILATSLAKTRVSTLSNNVIKLTDDWLYSLRDIVPSLTWRNDLIGYNYNYLLDSDNSTEKTHHPIQFGIVGLPEYEMELLLSAFRERESSEGHYVALSGHLYTQDGVTSKGTMFYPTLVTEDEDIDSNRKRICVDILPSLPDTLPFPDIWSTVDAKRETDQPAVVISSMTNGPPFPSFISVPASFVDLFETAKIPECFSEFECQVIPRAFIHSVQDIIQIRFPGRAIIVPVNNYEVVQLFSPMTDIRLPIISQHILVTNEPGLCSEIFDGTNVRSSIHNEGVILNEPRSLTKAKIHVYCCVKSHTVVDASTIQVANAFSRAETSDGVLLVCIECMKNSLDHSFAKIERPFEFVSIPWQYSRHDIKHDGESENTHENPEDDITSLSLLSSKMPQYGHFGLFLVQILTQSKPSQVEEINKPLLKLLQAQHTFFLKSKQSPN